MVLAVGMAAAEIWLYGHVWRAWRSSGPSPTWTPERPPGSSGAPRNPVYDTTRRLLEVLPVKGWDRAPWVSASEKDAVRRVLQGC